MAAVHHIELHLLLLELLLASGLLLHFAALLLLDFERLLAEALHDLLVVHDLRREVFARRGVRIA